MGWKGRCRESRKKTPCLLTSGAQLKAKAIAPVRTEAFEKRRAAARALACFLSYVSYSILCRSPLILGWRYRWNLGWARNGRDLLHSRNKGCTCGLSQIPRVKEKALSYSWSSCRTPSPAKRFPFQTRLFFRFYARHYLFVLSRTSAYINEMGFPFRIEPPTMSVIPSQNYSFLSL